MKLTKEQVCRQIGAKIREERIKKGYTLEKLANEAEIDYSQLNRIELGKINTSIFQIYHISQHLQIPVPCLLYTSPSPRDRQKTRMPSSA